MIGIMRHCIKNVDDNKNPFRMLNNSDINVIESHVQMANTIYEMSHIQMVNTIYEMRVTFRWLIRYMK